MRSPLIAWKPLSREKIFSTRVFDIAEITSVSPAGSSHSFFTLEARDWVIVVPVCTMQQKDHFLMVRQWRHGSASESIEFPGGVIDQGEQPVQAASRELLEETGYTAGSMKLLSTLSPNPAIMSNHCHIFLAEGLTNTLAPAPDDDEYIHIETLPVSDVLNNMGHGEYTHALMLSALFLYLQKRASITMDTLL